MSLMFEPLRKYAQFEGRARRSEFWLFTLFQFLVTVTIVILIAITSASADAPDAPGQESNMVSGLLALTLILFWLVMIIPGLAVTVRRLHDSDKSGFWLLLNLIPFGGFVIFIFTLLDGTPGPNRHGPDDKGRAGFGPGPAVVHHHHYAPGTAPVTDGPGAPPVP
jgi:uncharacterized membrane protein YhaH (DUF805 family)